MATSSTTPIISPGFQPILGESSNQFQQFQLGAPDILSFYQNVPGLNVPGLDPTQTATLNQLVGTGTNNADLANARAQIAALSGGPIGSSPVTQQAMQAYRELSAPLIEQQSALRGTAGGGQAIEALGQGQTAALVPFLEQEVQNKSQAVGQTLQIEQQNMQNLAMALEAAGLPREVALEQAQAAFQQKQQQWQTGLGLQTYPFQYWGPAALGSRSGTSPSGFDYLTGAIKAIGPAIGALAAA